jgi:hypothetical protein
MRHRDPTTLDLFELDIDTRLLSVWAAAWSRDDISVSEVGPFIRVAYVDGYRDALAEGRRGGLFIDHGITVPRRRRAGVR